MNVFLEKHHARIMSNPYSFNCVQRASLQGQQTALVSDRWKNDKLLHKVYFIKKANSMQYNINYKGTIGLILCKKEPITWDKKSFYC